MNGTTSLYDADLKGPAAIVIGSEGSGMSRLVAENCDFTVSIPMKGEAEFPERLRRRGHPALRGRAAENELTQTVSFSPLFKEPYISCLETVKNRIMNSTP